MSTVAAGSPTPFAEGIWVDTGPVNIAGMPLTSTMTVIRLGDGSLVLHSPVEPTPERRAAVEALGPATLAVGRVLRALVLAGDLPGLAVHGPGAELA